MSAPRKKPKVNSRGVGHAYERELRLRFIKMGFDKCQTSRFASKMMDDAGVDFVGTGPLYVQAKRTAKQPSFRKVLGHMPEDSHINVVYHKIPNEGELVVMRAADFEDIVDVLLKEGIWKTDS